MILLSTLTKQIVVVDALDSTSDTSALSANQGRVLNEAIANVTVDLSQLHATALSF